MAITITPNMSLPVPGVGTEAGPAYATDVNNCLTIVDAHDHTPGNGVQITPSALNINSDLLINGNNITTARSLRLSPQVSPLSLPSDLGCVYEVGVDLYYNDGSGNVIRITQSGAVAGTPGSISNLVSPASASYSSSTKTFTFESDALTPANLDVGSVIIRNVLASSNGITLSAPSALSSNYTVTLPALPASTLPVSISSSGNLSAAPITLAQLDSAVSVRFTTAPTIQKFTSGAGTYTTPTSPAPLYIRVRAVGAGGGGGGPNSGGASAGAAGTDTIFGSFTLGGGQGANAQTSSGSDGGLGGIATAVGITGLAFNGQAGSGGGGGSTFPAGGAGGSTPLGGGGAGAKGISSGNPNSIPAINSGGGGGGAGGNNTAGAGGGGGGGAGAYLDTTINSPSATYAIQVGVGGVSGAGAAGNGADGLIIVEEYYS